MSMTNRNRAAVAAKPNARPNHAPIAMAILLAIPILLLGCPEETPAPDSTPDKYVCENGTPAPGDAPAADTTLCASCEAGFLLNDAFACVADGDNDGDNVLNADDIDDDNDGLIEISSLLQLHNMRHNLAGTSYKTGATGAGVTAGAPAAATADCKTATGGVYLCGYELAQNLDFDADGDDRTWDAATLALDEGDDVDGYFDVDAGGWLPVGDAENPFVALFEGNGFTIANLAARRDQVNVGFFGEIGSGARVRNVGLTDVLAEYTGPDRGTGALLYMGGLAGQSSGTITASHTSGTVNGSLGRNGNVGGLVGQQQQGGSIIASFSSATVSDCAGGAGCGGLLGNLMGGSVVASYATGTVSTTNNGANLGGLVGIASDESNVIIASYAAGAVTSGTVLNRIGGLVGGECRLRHRQLRHRRGQRQRSE